MQFEHFGLNVPDSAAMADWYVQHCGMLVVRRLPTGNTYFLADDKGRVMMELYTNPATAVPDYAAQHPLRFHFAFAVPDPKAVRDKLVAAGASVFEELEPDAGTCLIMMRDPWSVPLQLCKRSEPLF